MSAKRPSAETRIEALVEERLRAALPKLAAAITGAVVKVLHDEGWQSPVHPAAKGPPAPSEIPLPTAEAMFSAAREGGKANFRALLDPLPDDGLRKLIRTLGYDRQDRTRQWPKRDRILDFLVDETMKRVERNQAFVSTPEGAAPMIKYGYAWEKLHLTVLAIAASNAPIQTRLAEAWLDQGHRLSGPPSHLPRNLQDEYDAIYATLSKTKDSERGAIRATCAAMTAEEASKIVDRIVSLYDAVCRLYYQSGG